MIFIGDIQRSQHRQAGRVHGVGLLRYRPHLGIHVLGQLQDVLRIRPAQIVSLIEDLHAHAVLTSVLRPRLPDTARHKLFHSCEPSRQTLARAPISSLPALPPECRSAATFSPPGRESLRAPAVAAPFRGEGLRLLLRVLPTAHAVAAHRVPMPLAPPALPYTSQLCDRLSVRARE